MLMVILGAGASFDSDPSRAATNTASIEESRPPLADQLFDDRPNFARIISVFPACRPIIPWLRKRDSGKSVEQVLEELQEHSKNHPARLSQLLAVRWYLRLILSRSTNDWLQQSNGVSNYTSLLDQIEHFGGHHQGVCIVTFNYDCLIESSLASIGIAINTIDDYIASTRYPLFKLHGSVNWTRQLDSYPDDVPNGSTIDRANFMIDHIAQISVSRRFAVASVPDPWHIRFPGENQYPAIAIPVERKVEFECPDNHMAELQTCIPRVTKILSIGWRGTEQHFLNLLCSGLKYRPKFLAVAGNESNAQTTINNIERAGILLDRTITSRNTFSQFILSREADAFLQMG